MRTKIAILLMLTCSIALQAQESYVAPQEPGVAAKLDQWQDLKFGVLFHWGLYSEAGVCESWPICSEDWITREGGMTYTDYKKWYWGHAEKLNPTDFDPAQWASAIKAAGIKYMIFTTKHHDGFCMYDSKQTDFTIAQHAFKDDPRRDVAARVFDAFRAQGIWAGAYFSKPDWHSQDYWWDYYATPDRHANYNLAKNPERWQAFKDYTYNQISEIMHGYGPLDILWLDGGWVATGTREDVDMDRIGAMAREAQGDILIVDRTVGGRWENYCTPEQNVPEEPLGCPWESCITLKVNWGYVPGEKSKSVAQVISTLAEITAKGGNLLLGVGPNPKGLIEQEVVDSLACIGRWLEANGEAIYSTRSTEHFRDPGVWYTASKDGITTYAIAVPGEDGLVPEEVTLCVNVPSGSRLTSLQTGKSLKWRQTDAGAIITLPKGIDRTLPVAIKIAPRR